MQNRINYFQKKIYQNKVNKGFNIDNIEKELCLMSGEITEFYAAYRNQLPSIGEELADVAIYLLGISEILGIDLDSEIERKILINENREYTQVNGVSIKVPSGKKHVVDCIDLYTELIEAIKHDKHTEFQEKTLSRLKQYNFVEFKRLLILRDKPSTQNEIAAIILKLCDSEIKVLIHDDLSCNAFSKLKYDLRDVLSAGKVLLKKDI